MILLNLVLTLPYSHTHRASLVYCSGIIYWVDGSLGQSAVKLSFLDSTTLVSRVAWVVYVVLIDPQLICSHLRLLFWDPRIVLRAGSSWLLFISVLRGLCGILQGLVSPLSSICHQKSTIVVSLWLITTSWSSCLWSLYLKWVFRSSIVLGRDRLLVVILHLHIVSWSLVLRALHIPVQVSVKLGQRLRWRALISLLNTTWVYWIGFVVFTLANKEIWINFWLILLFLCFKWKILAEVWSCTGVITNLLGFPLVNSYPLFASNLC